MDHLGLQVEQKKGDPQHLRGHLIAYVRIEGTLESRAPDAESSPLEALVRDGVLVTADLKRCGVAGVMRAELLFQAESLAIPTQITDISLDQLQWADEVFVCNSVYGIWPVRAYAALSWPVGPLTRKLQTIARALLDV